MESSEGGVDMKIIEQGKDMLKRPESLNAKCIICGCVFEYKRTDIQMQERNETFVKCPNRSCSNKINV